MTDSQADLDLDDEVEYYPFPILSWLAVLLVFAALVNPALIFGKAAPAENAVVAADADKVENPNAGKADAEPLAFEAYLVKMAWGMQVFSNTEPQAMLKQLEMLDEKGPQEQLALAMVEAVAINPGAALERLEKMEPKVKGRFLESSFAVVFDWVKRLKNDPKASIEAQVRQNLAKQMGWFASIPGNEPPPLKDRTFWLNHPESFYGSMIRFATNMSAVFLLAFCGLIVGVVLLLFFALKASKEPLGPGLDMPSDGPALSAIMMQTFAIWIVSYFALMALFGQVIVPKLGLRTPVAYVCCQLLSLGVLFWPVVRGVPLSAILVQTGLGKDTGSPREIAYGILGAVSFWPVLLFLLALTTALIQAFPDVKSSHPLKPQMLLGTRFDWILLFISAVVLAPIVEEIFFRGFLYRHLREASFALETGMAILLSVAISSFIFAAIHPQGILGIPVIGGLGALFALLRETRNNLTASIAAHSFNNCCVFLLIPLFL